MLVAATGEQRMDFKHSYMKLFASDTFQKEMDGIWSSICGRLEATESRKSFLVAAAAMGDGCTSVTMGLGRFVAENTDKDVVLVDAQLEDHRL